MAEPRSSAALRIASIYSAAFALAILLLGSVVFMAADAQFRRQRDASIAEESLELLRDYRIEGMDELRENIARREIGSATNAFGYALFDASGRKIDGALAARRPPAGWQDLVVEQSTGRKSAMRGLATRLDGGRILFVAIDTTALVRLDRTLLGYFAAALALVVIMGAAGALILGGYLRGRLNRISGTARAIVAGDLGRRVPVSPRGDEFDRLGGLLNTMLDRIAELMQNLQQVSGDVAHDLRTPLARMRAALETALDGPQDLQVQRAALKDALRQSDDLLSLFAAILRISEVEGSAIVASFAAVDLSALLEDLGESYAPAVIDGGRTLDCAVEPRLTVHGDRELIAQALINLLDNAQIHTPVGTHIQLGAEALGADVAITLADDGPGVAAADRDRIVRRFVRLDASRTTGGHGLGLNLVSAIVRAHRGTLEIRDNRPGLKATVLLPRKAE